jgi:hypothetical protein
MGPRLALRLRSSNVRQERDTKRDVLTSVGIVGGDDDLAGRRVFAAELTWECGRISRGFALSNGMATNDLF